MWSKVVSGQTFEAAENITPVLFMNAVKPTLIRDLGTTKSLSRRGNGGEESTWRKNQKRIFVKR